LQENQRDCQQAAAAPAPATAVQLSLA
jgi:hypothetical protein